MANYHSPSAQQVDRRSNIIKHAIDSLDIWSRDIVHRISDAPTAQPYMRALGFLAVLMLGVAAATLAIDLLRAPLYYCYEYLWVWWCSGPSHWFLRPL